MQKKSIAVLARYLRDGWSVVSNYDTVALGFDPFTNGPVTEQAFRERAAELLDALAADHFVED